MKETKFDFKFLNTTMYTFFIIGIYFVLKAIGIMDKIESAILALLPVLVGILLCWFTEPIKNFFYKRLKFKKNFSAFLALVLVFGIIILIFSIIIPICVEQFTSLIKDVPTLYNKAADFLNPLIKEKFGIDNALGSLQDIFSMEFLQKYATSIVDYSISTVQSISNIVVSFATVIIVSFFMVKDFDVFKERIFGFFSKNSTNKKRYKLLVDIDETLMSYIKGSITDALVVGILVTIVCLILGIKYGVVFGLMSAVLNLVPYVGAILSEVIVAIYAAAYGGPIFGIVTFVCLLFVQIVDANILQPNIIAKSVDLHPVVVISGLIVFELIFGAIGMLIATPVVAILKLILEYKFNINFEDVLKDEDKDKNLKKA